MTVLARKNKPVIDLEDLYERARASYLGLAIGDALGASVEFMTPREIQSTHGIHKQMIGGGWLNLKPGQVTDDTEMALALGQALIDGEGDASAAAICEAFSLWMSRKPVDIGNTVRRGIVTYRKKGLTAMAKDPYAAGNGAAMRCLPIALVGLGKPLEDLKALSDRQAHTTHNCTLSDDGTFCVVQLIQSALLEKHNKDRLFEIAGDLVSLHGDFAYGSRRMENPSGYIVETLIAVFQAFFETDSFSDCLINVVNRGGDADTTGAIAGMLAGAWYGADSIPQDWLFTLDQTILSYCEEQAASLVSLSALVSE